MAGPVKSLTIRRAGTEDLDSLAPLFDGYRQFYGQPPAPDSARTFIGARLNAEDSVLFLAESAERNALGFTQLYPVFSSIQVGRTYLLNDLFVVPEGRGGGVARALVQAAEAFAQRAGALGLDLSTARNNTAAQALYRSLGWVQDEAFITFHRRLDN